MNLITVRNPDNGPCSGKVAHWSEVVRKLQSANILVVGYVDTAYAALSQSSVEDQIDSYYSWYGLDGIFFDDVGTDSYDYYKTLSQHAKKDSCAHLAILNPGAAVPSSYAEVADNVIIYENDAVPTSLETNGTAISKIGVLVHGSSDSQSIIDNVGGFAAYVYTSPD